MNSKLTLQALEEMQPGTIFARGETTDSPEGANMTNSGRQLRYVAVRGGIADWAIYVAPIEWSDQWTKERGDKVHTLETIRRLVPCSDDAFATYRY